MSCESIAGAVRQGCERERGSRGVFWEEFCGVIFGWPRSTFFTYNIDPPPTFRGWHLLERLCAHRSSP